MAAVIADKIHTSVRSESSKISLVVIDKQVADLGATRCLASSALVCFREYITEKEKKRTGGHMPPVRFELTTPGLRDQCSATELKRRFMTPRGQWQGKLIMYCGRN